MFRRDQGFPAPRHLGCPVGGGLAAGAEAGLGLDYLRHLGYGADPLAGQNLWPTIPGYGGGANVATGGVDLANWVVRQFGGGGNTTPSWMQQWDPNISSGPSGNPGGTVWDATPWLQQWDPSISSGPSGNPGGTVWDATPWLQQWDPSISSGPSGNPGGTVWDASPSDALPGWLQQYRGPQNPSLPPPGTYSGPGYPGSAILPPPGTYQNADPGPGLGYEGSYGITTADPGIVGLGGGINRHAHAMINQGYQQAYNFNQQQAAHNQQMLNQLNQGGMNPSTGGVFLPAGWM